MKVYFVIVFGFGLLSFFSCNQGSNKNNNGYNNENNQNNIVNPDCVLLNDDDNDTILNRDEGCLYNTDSDEDGVPDYLDNNTDGDGISDIIEAGDNNPQTIPMVMVWLISGIQIPTTMVYWIVTKIATETVLWASAKLHVCLVLLSLHNSVGQVNIVWVWAFVILLTRFSVPTVKLTDSIRIPMATVCLMGKKVRSYVTLPPRTTRWDVSQ